MEELSNKEEFIKFAQIIEKMKNQNNNEGIQLSIEEKTFLMQIKEKYAENPKYMELIKKVMDSSKGEAVQVVQNFYNLEKEQKKDEDKDTEEKIAKVFGVSADQIKHLYLANKKEVFAFYSEELGKDVVLENNKTGKSITEVLREIQDSDEKYQTDNPSENANDIMMDERLKSNLELDMYPPKEVLDHTSEIERLTENEKSLLSHLVNHAEELNIKGINIENLIYITNDHEIKEIVYDNEFKPVIDSPTGEDTSSEVETVEKETETIDSSFGEVDGMDSSDEMSDSFGEVDSMDSSDDIHDMLDDDEAMKRKKEEEEKKERENKDVKKLVLIKPDERGFAAVIGLLAMITIIISLAIIVLRIFSII